MVVDLFPVPIGFLVASRATPEQVIFNVGSDTVAGQLTFELVYQITNG